MFKNAIYSFIMNLRITINYLIVSYTVALQHQTQRAPHNLQINCALQKLLKLRIQAGLLTGIDYGL
jgi:hypothetical protein